MPELNRVKKLIEGAYPISVVAIQSLQQHVLDWRGIYRVDDGDGQAWVVRIVRRQEAKPWLKQPAIVLRRLAAHGYTAPKVLLTSAGETVAVFPQWWMLITSYVHGQVIEPAAADLSLLGAAVARLHQLPMMKDERLPPSWWDRDTAFPAASQQLAAGLARTPPQYRPLVRALLTTVEQLQRELAPPTTLIHGDCWHANAVRTPDNTLVLIDWDCAGLGPAVLDLGNLLLTCHYDLAAPFAVEPDERRVHAVIAGYQAQRPLMEQERAVIAQSIRFPLAFFAGRYLEQMCTMSSEDLFWRKLQNRFDITERVAQMALTHFEQPAQPFDHDKT